MIEHRDIFRDPNRIIRRQDDPELSDPNPLGLHPDVEIEQHRVIRDLETLGVKMMLGERDRIIAERVGQLGLRGDLAEHLVVQLAAQSNHALFDLGAIPDRRQIKKRDLHSHLSDNGFDDDITCAR